MIVIGIFTVKIGLLVGVFGAPIVAKAGILSIVSSIFSPNTATAEENLYGTSQKMALLEAPVSATAKGSVNTPGVAVVNNALVPEGMIPFVSTAAAKESNSALAKPESNEVTNYKVKEGDTISSIAEDNNISINTIIWANNLKKTSILKVGQNLVLLPISGTSHKVVSGDTLQAIAIKYHGSAKEIASFNDIEDSKLKIGDIVIIPDGEGAQNQATPVKTATSAAKKVASAAFGVNVASADSQVSSSGYYVRPIKGGVRTQGIHGSNGVDLADSCGSGVYASAAGSVEVSKSEGDWDGGYGNYVVIRHGNGSQTLYAHLTKAIVSEGSTVSQGQMIGTIGATGKVSGATGCHLHFEIRNGIRNPF